MPSDDESSSEDEQVEVESSDSEQESSLKRSEVQAPVEVESSSKPVVTLSEAFEASSKKDEVKSVAEKVAEVIAEVSRPQYYEVVVIGVMRFMPVEEIASEASARSARRINKRVNGELQPTTAVVLRFDDNPPEHVIIHHERFRTRSYIHQTTRCFNCQGFNHHQAKCKKPARCARCGNQHKTVDCRTKEESKIRCANCQGQHSSAASICPKYRQVQAAWKVVTEDKLSYAEAIRKVTKTEKQAVNQQPTTCCHTRRADVIDLSYIPTSVQKQWAVKKNTVSTNTIATQTEDEPISEATQTMKDSEVQTEGIPVEKVVQIPDEVATQTAEFKIISSNQDQEEKWFFTTVFQIVGIMMTYLDNELAATSADGWQDLTSRFHYAADKMIEAGYPLPVPPRRSNRQTKLEPFLAIPAFKKKQQKD